MRRKRFRSQCHRCREVVVEVGEYSGLCSRCLDELVLPIPEFEFKTVFELYPDMCDFIEQEKRTDRDAENEDG